MLLGGAPHQARQFFLKQTSLSARVSKTPPDPHTITSPHILPEHDLGSIRPLDQGIADSGTVLPSALRIFRVVVPRFTANSMTTWAIWLISALSFGE